MKLSSPRRSGFVLAGILTLACLVSVALAAVLLTETFPYADGNLVGQGGWTAHSGAAAKPIQVISGAARVEQSALSGEDVNTTFPVQSTSAKTWASFKLRVPSIAPGGGAPTFGAGDYFAHFRPLTLINNFRARVYTLAPTGSGYKLGLSTTSSGTSPIVPMAADLNFDQDYTVVISYDAATGTSTLSVNGVAGQVVSANVAAIGEDINQFALRQASTGVHHQFVDDIRVGQDSSDLSPDVPGVLPAGVAALASLMFGAGALVTFRRTRKA